jgi:hypothetical protein
VTRAQREELERRLAACSASAATCSEVHERRHLRQAEAAVSAAA